MNTLLLAAVFSLTSAYPSGEVAGTVTSDFGFSYDSETKAVILTQKTSQCMYDTVTMEETAIRIGSSGDIPVTRWCMEQGVYGYTGSQGLSNALVHMWEEKVTIYVNFDDMIVEFNANKQPEF